MMKAAWVGTSRGESQNHSPLAVVCFGRPGTRSKPVGKGNHLRHVRYPVSRIMFDPSSFADPTPLAHADTSREVLPRGGTSEWCPTRFNLYDPE
ncbi:hypothetical protein TNCV_3447771 [Trichonephila clavipes]|nr:hypothetical protein TNCV_3447771 [Trichonephila clavipes]